MNPIDRKAAIRGYRKTPPPPGIYRIRNMAKGIAVVDSAMNPTGRLNRHRFELQRGAHPNAALQADWNELGPDAFEFTVLDTLDPSEDPSRDPKEELGVLLDMWIEKVRGSGVALYGPRPAPPDDRGG